MAKLPFLAKLPTFGEVAFCGEGKYAVPGKVALCCKVYGLGKIAMIPKEYVACIIVVLVVFCVPWSPCGVVIVIYIGRPIYAKHLAGSEALLAPTMHGRRARPHHHTQHCHHCQWRHCCHLC